MVKHSRMNEAQRELNEAKKALQVFSSQLRALDYAREITLDTGDFLGVADYIFDSLITDFMMQSRIREAQEKLDQTILQVLQMREDLEAILKER